MFISNQKVKIINQKLDKIAKKLEARTIAEYVNIMENTKQMMWKNFVIGVSKGIGIAMGFSIFGALLLYLFRRIVMLNIPVIGAFIKDIMDIVEEMKEIK